MKKLIFLVLMVALALAIKIDVRRASAMQSTPVFRTSVRLVEVYATVLDKHDRYVIDLSKEQFEIRDNGVPCQIERMEPITTGFDCAILMDQTGSVLRAMPTIKNSMMQFIDAFRAEDRLAIYGFNLSVEKSQDFTQDKDAAKRAVLRAIAGGATALFDSISEILQRLSARTGKKAVVVFTDGNDNSSFLNAQAVVRRAKSLGIPLYFVAQGDAAEQPRLLDILKEMSSATAGETYAVEKPSAVGRVFERISRDLHNSYLLTYAPPSFNETKWRTIQLTVKGNKDLRIHAREGYIPN
jgi:Ca-activated chloride channel homolog